MRVKIQVKDCPPDNKQSICDYKITALVFTAYLLPTKYSAALNNLWASTDHRKLKNSGFNYKMRHTHEERICSLRRRSGEACCLLYSRID